jgi:hypothetical protein
MFDTIPKILLRLKKVDDKLLEGLMMLLLEEMVKTYALKN